MTNISLFEYTIFLEQENNSIESNKQIQIEKTQANNIINENELIKDFEMSIINASKNKEFKLKKKLYNLNKIGGKSTNNKTQYIFLNQKRKRSENNKKNGRISKKDKAKGVTGNHTKDEYDNMKRKVITDCVTEIHTYINNSIKEEYKIKFYKPTITPQMKTKNDNDVKELSKKRILDIYLCSKPKRCIPDYAKKIEKDIKDIIKGENENKYKTINKLNIIFLKELKEFLVMYLNDDIYLKLNDGNSLRLKGFKTYKYKFKDINPSKKIKNKTKLLNLFLND